MTFAARIMPRYASSGNWWNYCHLTSSKQRWASDGYVRQSPHFRQTARAGDVGRMAIRPFCYHALLEQCHTR
jgi:hypothetical protein